MSGWTKKGSGGGGSVGPQGPQGPPGPAGPQGPSGSGSGNPIQGKTWNVLGDSVTEGFYWGQDPGSGTLVEVATYRQQIESAYGIISRNYGIGGTKITATGDGKGFCQRYTAMDNNADIVTVFGGINDYADATTTPIGTFGSSDTSTIYGAMKVLCEGLLQKYPTQKLGFILPFSFNEYKGAGTWAPYATAMKTVLEYYGIPYLDLQKVGRLNANVDFINNTYFKQNEFNVGDRTHPTTKGHAILASKIYSFLLTL